MNKQALRVKVKQLDVQPNSIVTVRLANVPNPQKAKEIATGVEANIRAVCPDFKGRILMLPMEMAIEAIPPAVLESMGWVRAWEPLPEFVPIEGFKAAEDVQELGKLSDVTLAQMPA